MIQMVGENSGNSLSPPIFLPILCLHFLSYLLCGASCEFCGQDQLFVFSDSYFIRGFGRSPEKWHVNNAMALCQMQLNLSLRISHGPDHMSLWCSEMLSNELIFLACRWTGIMCPQILMLMALLWSSSLALCGACLQIMHSSILLEPTFMYQSLTWPMTPVVPDS